MIRGWPLGGEMKTLVVRPGRRAALSSREPKINRSPWLPETPSSRHVALRNFLRLRDTLRIPRTRPKRSFISLLCAREAPLLAIKLQAIVINSITSTALFRIRRTRLRYLIFQLFAANCAVFESHNVTA